MNNIVPISQGSVTNYSAQQLALIKNTVAADCNSLEFDLFMAVANQKGLDPFAKQIHAIVYNKDKADKRKMAIITAIDGFRVIAERTGVYRPDEDEPEFTYDESLKGPANPLGLVKAKVKVWKNDRPATGVAYWDEFAPVKEEVEGGFDWVDTGEVWPDTGKPKKRKVARNQGAEVIKQVDGNWLKMPRVMLAKCAEAQALRKAFPERLSGLYEGAEFDRTRAQELSPSELVEVAMTENRMERIGGGAGILMQFNPHDALESVQLGQMADRTLGAVAGFSSVKQYDWFASVNRAPLQQYWARSPGEALEVKGKMEARRAALVEAEAKAEVE